MNDWNSIGLIFGSVVGLVLLFAQAKLFSIDSNLREIRKILEEIEIEKVS